MHVPMHMHCAHRQDASLLGATVMLKLNGGLGTGMGLEKVPLLEAVSN